MKKVKPSADVHIFCEMRAGEERDEGRSSSGNCSSKPTHNFPTGVNQCSSTFLVSLGQAKVRGFGGRQSLRDLRGSQWDQERLRESGEELRGAEMMGVRSD